MNEGQDWRMLPAGRELDYIVAAQAGWRIESRSYTLEKDTWLWGDWADLVDVAGLHEVVVLIDPNGNIYPKDWDQPDGGSGWVDDDNKDSPKFVAWPESYILEHYIPKFSTDANAALSLPLDKHWWFELVSPPGWGEPKHWGCKVTKIGKILRYLHGDTPALTVCRAWLAWQDEMAGQ